MKILGINGSPRKDGNTSYALRYYIDALKIETCDIKTINVEDISIIPCRSCFSCRNNKDANCVLRDQSSYMYNLFKESDMIIIASPVYIGSITPQLLSLLVKMRFLDRGLRNFDRKIGVPIVLGRRAGHNFALSQILQFFFISGMKMVGSQFWNILISGVEKDSVAKDLEGLNNLRHHAQIARDMLRNASCEL